ncbi:MAG: penicillin-binding protein activator LpoB [Verrucomicrobiota bacterium]|jgi:PBP1b-binding outer membrane lipoprotein LpoB
MNRAFVPTAIALATAAFLGGCATQTTYVDPGSTRTITNVGELNVQDWNMASEAMVNSLISKHINSGALKGSGPDGRAVLAISRIVNSTSLQIDTDVLVKKIRVSLLGTGKVVADITAGLGGPEDPLAAEAKREQQFLGTQKVAPRPDYTLSGKIIENRTRQGNKSESTYIFQMALATRDGLAVWEEEKTITKQGKRSAVGW